MADKTAIEWTDATWNPLRGCSVVSPGCVNCYAMKTAWRHNGPRRPYEGLTKRGPKGPIWTGDIMLVPKVLDQPLRWKKPRMVFVNSMSDLFHEKVPFEFIAAVFGVMAASPQHTFQVLTKRPERALEWFYLADNGVATAHGIDSSWLADGFPGWPLPNVWMGVSVEDQQRADERIPVLLDIPAAVRWVSAEPLLGPVNLRYVAPWDDFHIDALETPDPTAGLDWVVVGGESGPGARPMHPDWARSLRDQCVTAGVPFFFKQWGAWAHLDDMPEAAWVALDNQHNLSGHPKKLWCIGKKAAGRELDDRMWNQMP